MALTDKLTAIGDAIRYKTGGTSTLTLSEMPSAIKSIEGGSGETTTSLWENGTWEEIHSVLDSYYAEEISDLSLYFKVGDKRQITISAIAGTTDLPDTHEETTVYAVIIGVEHDDLATPVSDNRTKAAITVQLFDMMTIYGKLDTFSGSTSVSTTAPYGYYEKLQRRNWLNSTFLLALPSEIKGKLKTVTKLSARGVYNTSYISSSYKGVDTSNETVFLLSYSEVLGGHMSTCSADDGVQYEYYKDRYKYPHFKADTSTANRFPAIWWSRTSMLYATSSSSSVDKTARYYIFTYSGTTYSNTTGTGGFCPAWCM